MAIEVQIIEDEINVSMASPDAPNSVASSSHSEYSETSSIALLSFTSSYSDYAVTASYVQQPVDYLFVSKSISIGESFPINYGITAFFAGDNTDSAGVYAFKARGTFENKSAVLNGDNLFTFGAGGYDGTDWIWNRGCIFIRSTANWSPSNRSTKIIFATTNGTTRTDVLTINNDTNVGIGTTSPSSKLHVIKTTEQLRIGYNTSQYYTTTVDSTGSVIFDIVGTSPKFIFNDNVGIGTTSPTTKLDVNGSSSFGNVSTGNYTSISDKGEIKLYGSASYWDDLLSPLIGQRLESPASHIIQNSAEGTLEFKNNCDLTDYVIINSQLTNKWKIGSAIHPHIHWEQTSANPVNWLIQYRWQKQGGTKVTTWTNNRYASSVFNYTSGTLNQITEFNPIIPPSGSGLSDIIQIRLLRDVNNDSLIFSGSEVTPTSVYAVNFDIHVECDSLGSEEEYIK